MNCERFKTTASAFMDGELTGGELTIYRGHLTGCSECRAYVSDLQETSSLLRSEPAPAPRELHDYVMTSVATRAARSLSPDQLFVEWLQKLNPRVVSYATGALVSAVMFAIFISIAKPIPVSGTATAAAIYPVVTGSDREFRSYNDIPTDSKVTSEDHYYELPRVLDNGSLVSFSHIAYQKPGPEGLAALVEIAPDGRAQLVNILQDSADPYLVEQLWWSLNERTFQPATVAGRPVSTRIVLFVEKVDVRG